MDSMRVSEAPDTGSIPVEATKIKFQAILNRMAFFIFGRRSRIYLLTNSGVKVNVLKGKAGIIISLFLAAYPCINDTVLACSKVKNN
jgi:hypothetical protein